MKVSIFTLALYLLGLQVVASKHVPLDWTPLNWTTIPEAQPDDVVEVWYLLSPLLEEDFGDLLGSFKLFHGAIGLNNTRTGLAYTLNYDANNFFRNSLFPNITTSYNGSVQLNWDNGGAAFIYADIFWGYWNGSADRVATINGTTFNTYITEWVSQINGSYPYYDMFGITQKFGVDPWVPSWDCYDYAWASFQFFYESSATMNTSVVVSRNYLNVYSSEPSNVTALFNNDPKVHQEIIDFYSVLDAQIGDLSWWELIMVILDVGEGNFFVRIDTDYWRASLVAPYFGIEFAVTPIPGQPQAEGTWQNVKIF